MTVRAPTGEELARIAREVGLSLTSDELDGYHALVNGMVAGLGALDAMPDALPPVQTPRAPGARPAPEDNPLGAWYVKTRIEGAADGPLRGRTVVLKDNVMLAGVPMMNGTSLLEGYVPPMDATVATRVLDAGGTIVGKSVCEAFCLSGGSHTSDTGPVRNPHRPEHSAGGSSSGSGALVAAGEVDMAIGCDQGGSIRMPASFCGIVGMKATHGLVPYTGILGMDPTIDHVGPMTANVDDNALLLEVLAGPDGLDSRQVDVRTAPYRERIDAGADGLRIGVLREGFGLPGSEPDVDAKVRAAGERFARLGAVVSQVSVPQHATGGAISLATMQGSADVMLHSGLPTGREGVLPTSYLDLQRGWRERADELPPTVKLVLLLGVFVTERHGYRYYARAMGWMRRLRAAYDDVLRDVDLLLLPTTPMRATPLPPPGASVADVIGAAFAPTANTQLFDHTHHPALSFPCGMSDGLPVGAMLVGRHWEEPLIYRAARAFEQSEDWRRL